MIYFAFVLHMAKVLFNNFWRELEVVFYISASNMQNDQTVIYM